jgi:DinB superfamily
MSRAFGLTIGILSIATSVAGQTPAAPQKIGLAQSMQQAYATVKTNLTRAADSMPDTEYGFKLVQVDGVRTFGQWIGHQTDNQLGTCAALRSMPNPTPQGTTNERKWTTKAEFVKALNDAFAFCDPALSSLTDQNALQMVKQGQNETARGGLTSALLSHALETNGILTLYLRAKNIAPPTPERGGGRGARGRQ